MNTAIRAHQALFGYREGHRLLQASRSFAAPAERVLLALTDMSGPRMITGFEEYITAYPVPEDDSYAITRTWYASEMERPGCVWTHALLIPISELYGLRNLADVFRYFRRPEQTPQGYDLPVIITPESNLRCDSTTLESFEELLSLLYSSPDLSVLIPANDARTYEHLVCATWSQQWPSLRASFRLCTGALASRTMGGRPFDLQVVPQRLSRELQRERGVFAVLGSPSPISLATESWLRQAAGDLAAPTPTAIRSFLWDYADASLVSRDTFSKLARLYMQFIDVNAGAGNMAQASAMVCDLFPRASAGGRLKMALYGTSRAPNVVLPTLTEAEKLRQLSKCLCPEAFDVSQLQLRVRASAFWSSFTAEATNLLLEAMNDVQQSLAEEIVSGFAEAITAGQLCSIVMQRPSLIGLLAARNPALATHREFWSCSIASQAYYEVLDTLQSPNASLSPDDWIPAVLVAGTGNLASPIIERFELKGIAAVLNWLNNPGSDASLVLIEWREAIASQPDNVVSWLQSVGSQCRAATLAFAAATLDPNSPEVISMGLEPWLGLVSSPEWQWGDSGAASASFILASGLSASDPKATSLVISAFQPVYFAAARDQLSYRSWQLLKERLPSVRWGREWDKCERLRQGIVAHSVQNKWSASDFLHAVPDPDTFWRVLRSGREMYKGEAFLRMVADQVRDGMLAASDTQRQALDEAFPRTRWRSYL